MTVEKNITPYEQMIVERDTIRRDMGGAEKVAALHAAGDLTARDWIDRILDKGSFVEIGTFVRAENPDLRPSTPGDSKITGHGLVSGRPVTIAANDITVKGGTGSASSKKRGERIYEQALKFGNPYVFLGQAGGSRIPDILGSERMSQGFGIGSIASRRRRIPMAVGIVGRSYGDSSFTAAAADFVVQLRGTAMAVTSPRVVEIATSEIISEQELGGVDVHAERTGQIDLAVETQDDLVKALQTFLHYMPDNADRMPPRAEAAPVTAVPELRTLVPTERRRGYDMRKVIARVVDNGHFFELMPRFARSLITALARIDGRVVGVLANQPMQMGGAMTPDTCDKSVRFICMCDSFNIPLVFLADTPGFLVGKQVEHARLLNKAVMLNEALTQVKVPFVTFVLRKAYGLAYFAMAGGKLGASYMCGWPTAEISFMDPDVAVNVVYGPQLKALEEDARKAEATRLARELTRATSPFDAAAVMGLDEVIDPADTRLMIKQVLDRTLEVFDPKHRERPLSYWPTCF